MNRRGFTLMELIVAMGVTITLLSIGYSMYANILRMDDRESRKESMTNNVQGLMSRIKHDVRAGSSVNASSGSLVINGSGGRIVYRTLPGGEQVERTGRARVVYKDVSARFASRSGGADIKLESKSVVYGRPVQIEVKSFVKPRNL